MAHFSHPSIRGPLVFPSGKSWAVCWPDKTRILSAVLWLVFPLTLGLAITRQSLWIDEGFTVWFASHPSFHSFFGSLIGTRGNPGDPQFVFYLIHMWAWIKLFGSSELALRAANIPFAVIFMYTVRWASRRFFWNANLWVLFCLSPFFWFYLNEARPYVALMAFSCVASVALLAYLIDPNRYHASAPWVCLIGLFVAWGVHILAIFLVPALLVLIAISRDSKDRCDFVRHWSRPALCCSPAFAGLAAFYIWVSANGVNKTEADPGIANLVFATYEFLGFAGLGPPRNELREAVNLPIFLPYWPLLFLGFGVLAAVIFWVLRSAPPRHVRKLMLAVASGFVVALVVAQYQHFHILGRHLAALFPLTLMVGCVAPSPTQPAMRSRGAALSFITLALVWGISDARLVFLHKYAKDSYREACSIALAESKRDGAVILWAADSITASYYGLKGDQPDAVENRSSLARVLNATNWNGQRADAFVAGSSAPKILVLSKAATFDQNGAWTALLRQKPPVEIAHLNALSIYEWQAPPDSTCGTCEKQPPPQNLMVARSSARDSHFD